MVLGIIHRLVNRRGSVKAVIPPVGVFDAGPLSVITWLLEKLRAAQAEDGTVNVITKNTAITSTNKVRVTYNVTVDVDEADLSETLAANVDDNFS